MAQIQSSRCAFAGNLANYGRSARGQSDAHSPGFTLHFTQIMRPIRDKEPYLTALVASSCKTRLNGVASSGGNTLPFETISRGAFGAIRRKQSPDQLREIGCPPSATRSAECVPREGL